jgi:hypothetical protein
VDPIELLPLCIPTFERTQIGYFVTGSVASASYGEQRFTRDVDVVVHLESDDDEIICACFPEPEFYVSRQAVQAAIASAGQFNVVHAASGFKIDFMVSGLSEFDRSRFARARKVEILPGLEVRMASPEDVTVKKLEYFRAGGSDKHIRDIAGILRVLGDGVDRAYIDHWAARLGLEEQWAIARARADDPSY